jgi:GntR family transcriptional regulator
MTAYEKVAHSIRRDILRGRWRSGARLPADREFCQRFGTSSITLRRAMLILEQQLLVERRQGSGTYVAAWAERKIPILNADYTAAVSRSGQNVRRRIVSRDWIDADHALAAALDVAPGDRVLRVVRVDEHEGEPIDFDRVEISEQYADRLKDDDLRSVDFTSAWQRAQGFSLECLRQTIEACAADARQARLLNVRRGSPLLKETGVAFAASGRPAGRFLSYYRNDVFLFEAVVRWRGEN